MTLAPPAADQSDLRGLLRTGTPRLLTVLAAIQFVDYLDSDPAVVASYLGTDERVVRRSGALSVVT